jgi:hypothetical protein
MTNNEAKFILGAYRPNGRDAEGATFKVALGQARTDPALGAWFEQAQAHDAAMARKLGEIVPPAGLREAILAGARATRSQRRAWRTPAPWLALAASIALIVSVSMALRPARAKADATRFAAFAVSDTEHAKHGGHGPASGELAAVLASSSTRLGTGLPLDFSALRANGCRTVSFAGHDVLEVCFKREGTWFHCYIANRADFPEMAPKDGTVFLQQAKLASASWSDATHHFVVVGEAGVEAIKRLL